ncbi:MAG: cellulase family glycosylhydrolase [Opitutae bacterium]|nr:cellulase family glycosylhydrolase [Opitutae bacterium]
MKTTTQCLRLLPGLCLCLLLTTSSAATATITVQPLASPRLWIPVEFRLDGAPVTANNCDPDELALDAEISTPSGLVQRVPAFWFQDFTRTETETGEKLSATGEPGWRLRYTPTEPGNYAMTVTATRAGKPPATLAGFTFAVAAETIGERHGWVGIAADRRYFQTSDGRPLRLIGENVCWPEKGGTRDYDRWFKSLHDSGQNCARLWIAPWWAAIEQDPDSLTRYRQDSSWQLDRVFAAAEREGIYLILCLDFHGRFQSDNPAWGGSGNFWPKNPYNAANGGPCPAPNDFFTSPAARTIYEKRLRYLVARYGASPRLLAWQFFNEIDNVFEPRGLRGVDVAAWHGEVGRWLKAHDPYGHLVTTSLTGGSDREIIWKIPEMDFAVYHSYDESAPARANAVLAEDFHRRYGKPVVIGEYGVDSLGWARASDPHLRGLRQSLWGGAVGGAAGTPLTWWWNEMDQSNVYPVFAALSSILKHAGWEAGDWRPATVTAEVAPTGERAAPAEYSGIVNLNRLLRSKVPGKVRLTGPLSAERAYGSLAAILRGTDARFGPQSLEVSGQWGATAALTVHLRAVMGTPDLRGLVDGKEVSRLHIDTPKPDLPYRQLVDKTFTVAVPPGEHTVRLEIAEAGWTILDGCSVQGLVVSPADSAGFPPEAVALRQDDRAVVYVVSPSMVYPAGALREAGPRQQGHQAILQDWPRGRFKAEWFDPATAQLIGTTPDLVSDGSLRLSLPDYTEDVAAVITRQ